MKKFYWKIKGAAAVLVCAVLLTACADEEVLLEVPQTIALTREEASEEEQSGESQAGEGQAGTEQSTAPEETATVFLMESAGHFAYDSLTAEEQIWYRDIEQILGRMEVDGKMSVECFEAGLDETYMDKIFQCVLNDHPELFFVEGYTYTKYTRGDELVSIEFSGTYSMDRESALRRKQQIEEAGAAILAGINGQASDYDKIKYVYETIIDSTDYQLGSADNQNIYSVFVNHVSVCQGYAKATQYLLNQLGVECTLVIGTVDTGEGHAWNLVRTDDSYYYVDTTWGDASYRMADEETSNSYMPQINYDYLCVTTEQLLRTHMLGGCVPMPECIATKDNYYVREGALFTFYDKEQMRSLFAKAFEQGQIDVTVKCTDLNCFEEIQTALIDNQEIFDYFPEDSGTIAYAHNEKQLSLTFWVTNE